jgi:hypothetical protein
MKALLVSSKEADLDVSLEKAKSTLSMLVF